MMLYLIDTRKRFCEVGAWAVTQTISQDLILRRALSLGSLWDLAGKEEVKFNGVRFNGLVAVTERTYNARSSEGFTYGGGRSWMVKKVSAVIESGGKTLIKSFRVHIFPEETQLIFPKQPVQFNQAVRQAAYAAILLRQDLAETEWFITEGQSNTFRYAQLRWSLPADHYQLEFPVEHKESLASIASSLED